MKSDDPTPRPAAAHAAKGNAKRGAARAPKPPGTDPAQPAAKRAYNQGARALAAEKTAERILDAFQRRVCEGWFEEITLEAVARDAEVTVPTVVRRFGGKEGLLDAVQARLSAEIQERRAIRPGDACAAIRSAVEDYEVAGDLVIRFLAQEERHAPFKAMNNIGRAYHRAWVAKVFALWLDDLGPKAREARLDALVMALDVYVWQVLRRDMGRSREAVEQLMRSFVEGILGEPVRPLPHSDLCPEEVSTSD